MIHLKIHPSKKKKGGYTCPVCLEVILDSTKSKTNGHDAIYCEGKCNSWLYGHCTGLSKPVFNKFQTSPDRPHCLLKKHAAVIQDLKATITTLTETIASLQTSVKESVATKSASTNIPTEDVHLRIAHYPL